MKKKFEKLRNPIAEAPVDPPLDQPGDAQLLDRILDELATDGRLEGEVFDIEVERGCATLTGSISREYLRVLVNAHVCAVPGVHVVRDQLYVTQEGPMAGSGD